MSNKFWNKFYPSSRFGKYKEEHLLMTGYLRDTPEIVEAYDSLIANIQNAAKCNRTEAITKAMIFGLHHVKDYLQDRGELSQETKDAFEAFSYEVEESIQERKEKYVSRLYERNKIDKAKDYCLRNNLDFDAIVSEYTMPFTRSDKSSAIREWLKDYFSRNETAQVSRIRQDMLDDGVINPADWSLVRNIASTDGYSKGSKRGVWQRVLS